MNHQPTDATLAALPTHALAFEASTAPAIDLTTLRQRCLGNEAFANMLLDEFQSCVPNQLVDLSQLVAEANAPAIRDAAHSLKGIASTLAANGLRQAATDLEAAAISNHWTRIPNAVLRVHQEAQRCLAQIPAK
ncbi:MAG: Hpt domain-containing protein [Planctomycetaceae bacterium]